MFRMIPTVVDTGAARPIFVRLASGWILIKYAIGSRTRSVWIRPWTITHMVWLFPVEIAYHTEQTSRYQCLRSKPLQIIKALLDNAGIC